MKKSTFALNVYIWYMGSFYNGYSSLCMPASYVGSFHFEVLFRKEEECGEEVDR